MKNLIKYYTYLILKSKVLIISIVFTELMICGLFIPRLLANRNELASGNFDNWGMLGIALVIITICGYTTGVLFSQKSVQDTVSTGFSRQQIYFTKTLVNAIFCFVVAAINFITITIIITAFESEANFVIFDNLFPKFVIITLYLLWNITLCTALAFIGRSTIAGVILNFLCAWVGVNLIVTIPILLKIGGNYPTFFNNFVFRNTFYEENIYTYLPIVASISAVLILVFYLIGERNFRKADLK
jgi:hypothetical protein